MATTGQEKLQKNPGAVGTRKRKWMRFVLEPYLKSHRLDGLVEIEDLAADCTHHKIQVEYISKQELDASIDPATTTAQCFLESEGGVCIRFTAHTGEVITAFSGRSKLTKMPN